jgi:DNA-binding NarL/FixJ family response regulator
VNPIRVSIVEDNPAERSIFADVLNKSTHCQCVSVHASLHDAQRSLATHRPEVVLLDLRFEGEGPAYRVLPKLRTALPQAEFLILTRFDDHQDVFECLQAGACGYWLKSEPMDELTGAIRDCSLGRSPMSSVIARIVRQYFQRKDQKAAPLHSLSPRERQVLDFLAEGKSYKRIATDLGISYDTVRAHIREIYRKLEVHSRAEAVAKLLKRS